MSKVIVIGGGPAGMFAAIKAAQNGHDVTLLEKNEKLGKKLYITGKGRCNLTNACDNEDFFQNIMRNPKFFYSAWYRCNNFAVIDFFESNGLKTKIERGNRVFPQSDHASDVIKTLQQVLKEVGVTVKLHTNVSHILVKDAHVSAVRQADGTLRSCENIILATGGRSYPATGSTGAGYLFAEQVGHTITRTSPSLTPFKVAEPWIGQLQGLSLKNVSVRIKAKEKTLYESFGEMLFTHYGVSGPLLLSGSSVINDNADKMPLSLLIDLKPALSESQLDKRICREFGENVNRQFKNAIQKLFPAKIIPIILVLSRISPDKRVNEITKEERIGFVDLIKNFPLTLTELCDFNEAIITRGGVKVAEVSPKTMESKLVRGLFFAGEILDLDALTGGFNLQIAWSTGYLAGDSI
ncbi:NAD(P)/FAD-dependent oxidoreductase [Lachnospiraceae bacterium ZAX-1]